MDIQISIVDIIMAIVKEDATMARPKSGIPPKDKIHLSVSKQTRMELDFISQETHQSISQLMEAWAKKEARRLAKAAGKQLPDATQMTIDEVAANAED